MIDVKTRRHAGIAFLLAGTGTLIAANQGVGISLLTVGIALIASTMLKENK